MWLVLDLKSERPIYLQIRDQVVEAIASGRLAPGSALPPIRQLAIDFGINLHTVHKAYETLRDEGFVQLRRKVGATVLATPETPVAASDWPLRLRTLLAEPVARQIASDEIVAVCQRVLDEFASERSERSERIGRLKEG
ncbi:MAG TPA: GntR family transcriptional regulator [Ktedonobacterales bacterium]|nr:GntR family transcriptional regulator [Ktedonobacterales bacterium]